MKRIIALCFAAALVALAPGLAQEKKDQDKGGKMGDLKGKTAKKKAKTKKDTKDTKNTK